MYENSFRDNFIEIINLGKSFQVGDGTFPVLKGLDFEVEHGEFIAITGPSGNGKSTLLNMITGIRGWVFRSSARVWRPSISGISTSSVTRSGWSCGSLASAIFPFAATPTTSTPGSLWRSFFTSSRMTTESSTTRTRTFLNGYSCSSPSIKSFSSCRCASSSTLRGWTPCMLVIIRNRSS